jgi:teichuronic acid biosynthesis glycosyltransferase TuaC
MKILVLTKRQYMGKDLIDDRFGRFRELPLELARLGHEVQGLALSYRRRAQGAFVDGAASCETCVTWDSVALLNGYLPQIPQYIRHSLRLAQEFKPDVIWACSDAYHAIFGHWLAKHVRTRCVIDLYDNFEAFRATKFPGVSRLFKGAVKTADGVTCFSPRLVERIVRHDRRQKPNLVLESGVNREWFTPQNQWQCRQRLGLPEDATIIGTAGALDRSRGISTLFKAFDLLSRQQKHLHLAIAGPRERRTKIPMRPRVHDLGVLPHQEVPCFINALDLAVICYRQSAQGEFSFPQKAYEIMACRVPFIAARVGCMAEVLSAYAGCLYEPENPQSLAEAALLQLKNRTTVEIEVPSWADSAKKLSDFFQRIVDSDGASRNPDVLP